MPPLPSSKTKKPIAPIAKKSIVTPANKYPDPTVEPVLPKGKMKLVMTGDKGKTTTLHLEGELVGKLLIASREFDEGVRYCVYVPHVGVSCYVRLIARADAVKVAKVLWSKCLLAWREKTADEIYNKLPSWVYPWLRKCREAEKYVTPTFTETLPPDLAAKFEADRARRRAQSNSVSNDQDEEDGE